MSTPLAPFAQRAIAEIDAVLARAGLKPGARTSWEQFDRPGVWADLTQWATAWAATIDRWSPPGSRYREVLRELTVAPIATPRNLTGLVGLLNALRDDYEAGFVRDFAEIIHAGVFADFLETAAELLDKGYKDAAAVITGSVLEGHLRKLADKTGVPVIAANGKPKNADRINAEFVKAGAYGNLEQKQVTAWLDLRNKAAHGKYEEYDNQLVALMLEGVRAFLLRHPA